MHIVTMPLDQLKPAPYNPRVDLKPNDPRYRKLLRSVRTFGLVEPLIWNQRTGHVVGGHQRLKILRDLSVKEAPVSVVDLSPEREKALNVVLNNREAQSDYDTTRLSTLLAELEQSSEAILRETGFAPHHLEALRSQLAPAELPPAPEPPRWMEVMLSIPVAQFPAIRGELDAMIQRHGLESHVRMR
jgi:ParB-like chromosome segregation protein Spo0J